MQRETLNLTTSSLQTDESPHRDYARVAIDYARDALRDKKRKRHCVYIQQAAQRYLDDLRRARRKDCAFCFDPWQAQDVCDFIEKLPHVEGKWETRTIVLHPAQIFFLVQLFGFRNREAIVYDFGLYYPRRFTSALFAVARKNAKALALDTPIPTPGGWKRMGDLFTGDQVLGANGKPCNVTAISPIYFDRDCYSMIFSNGERIIADGDHLWLTEAQVDQPNGHRAGNRQTRKRLRTTREIAKTIIYGRRNDRNHSINMPANTIQIVSVEPVQTTPVKCIKVDSSDGMFLCGKTMIPTHNSTLASGILIYCLCCEPEFGAQLLTAATTYDQASIIYKIAKRMIELTPDLRDYFGVEVWAKTVTRLGVGAALRPIHAKASTQDGLNPSHTACDEIHAHKTADLLNVLTSAAGARTNPLWLYTTTEGYVNAGPWGDLKQFAKRLLAGVFGYSADHFLAVYYKLDEADKTLGIKTDAQFDEKNWIKANPLIDVNPHLLAAIRKEAIEAKQMPSRMAEFRIKRLNLPAASAEGWVNLTKWNQCAGAVDLKWLEQYPAFCGLDLASTSDITAFRLVWLVDDILYTHGLRWCPRDAVMYRTERGTVPYAAWVESGILRVTEGNSVDYAVIEADIKALTERFNIRLIAYDRWNAIDLCNRLTGAELPMIEYVQGPKSYHPAMQALEVAYMSGKLHHAGDPLLTWCASNLIARMDTNLNLAPDKKRSADKIDDMSALLMAVGIATSRQFKEPEYKIMIL